MLLLRQPREGRGTVASPKPPFPHQQLFILALCRICEPIAFMSIFPYAYYMVESFHITTNDHQIAVYVGMITSAFAIAEFSTGVIWGRLSDRVGRKPVLIAGLVGTLVSMLVFGFALSLPVALLGRALGGALNGNIGVINTTVAEIIREKEHQPRAYSIMPFVWSLGSIVGPVIGGALARPCHSFPTVFSSGSLFDHFPFLLPNLVCAAVLAIGVLVGVLFLEETHQEKKYSRDGGLEAGKWILSRFCKRPSFRGSNKAEDAYLEVSRPLLEDEPPPGYRTTEGSPRYPLSRSHSPCAPLSTCEKKGRARGSMNLRGIETAFTRQVIIYIISYGILAYHTISFDQLMPVFLESKVSTEWPVSPFKFVGGFGLDPQSQGILMAAQGVYAMFAQAILFPFFAHRLGYLRTFRLTAMSWPVLYLLVPYTVLLPKGLDMFSVCLCLLWRTTAQALTFPPNNIMLANSAPSTLVLGAINGVAGSTASLCRALGPTVTGIIHSQGLKFGISGLAWWVTGVICAIGALESLWMKDPQTFKDQQDPADREVNRDISMIDPLTIDAAIGTASKSSCDLAKGIRNQPKAQRTEEVEEVEEVETEF